MERVEGVGPSGDPTPAAQLVPNLLLEHCDNYSFSITSLPHDVTHNGTTSGVYTSPPPSVVPRTPPLAIQVSALPPGDAVYASVAKVHDANPRLST